MGWVAGWGTHTFFPVLILPHTYRITGGTSARGCSALPKFPLRTSRHRTSTRSSVASPCSKRSSRAKSSCFRCARANFLSCTPSACSLGVRAFKRPPCTRVSRYDALGGDEFLTRYRRSSVEHHLKVIPMSWLPLGHDDPLLLYGYTTATREAQRNSFPAAIFAFEARLPTSNLVARGVWTSPPTSHSSGVSSQRRIRGNERIVRRFRDAVVRRRWRRLHHHGDAGRCATC